MRTLLLLLLLTGVLGACSEPDSPDDGALLWVPEAPTPPPAPSYSPDLLASMPQEPLPEGTEPGPRPTDPIPGAGATPAVLPGSDSPPTPPAADSRETSRAKATSPAAPPASAAEGRVPMEVLEAAVARAVVDRKPSGTGPFAAGSEVHCFTRVANPGGQRRTLRHLWYHQGSRKGSIALQIKGRTWRTWSRLPVYSTGPWRVDVVDEDDTVLRSLEFVVE